MCKQQQAVRNKFLTQQRIPYAVDDLDDDTTRSHSQKRTYDVDEEEKVTRETPVGTATHRQRTPPPNHNVSPLGKGGGPLTFGLAIIDPWDGQIPGFHWNTEVLQHWFGSDRIALPLLNDNR